MNARETLLQILETHKPVEQFGENWRDVCFEIILTAWTLRIQIHTFRKADEVEEEWLVKVDDFNDRESAFTSDFRFVNGIPCSDEAKLVPKFLLDLANDDPASYIKYGIAIMEMQMSS